MDAVRRVRPCHTRAKADAPPVKGYDFPAIRESGFSLGAWMVHENHALKNLPKLGSASRIPLSFRATDGRWFGDGN